MTNHTTQAVNELDVHILSAIDNLSDNACIDTIRPEVEKLYGELVSNCEVSDRLVNLALSKTVSCKMGIYFDQYSGRAFQRKFFSRRKPSSKVDRA